MPRLSFFKIDDDFSFRRVVVDNFTETPAAMQAIIARRHGFKLRSVRSKLWIFLYKSVYCLFVHNGLRMLFLVVNGEVCIDYMSMRSIKLALSKENTTGWEAAVRLTEAYLVENMKANQLLENLPADFVRERRALCQSLFLGALRHGHRVRHVLQPHLRKTPRPMVEAVFLVAGYELLQADAETHPKIVHHAVEHSKGLVHSAELGFLNAVLRKLPEALQAVDPEQELAACFSHPQWMVARWEREFGADAARQLLEWNQRIPATYLKSYDPELELPESLEPTEWPQFFRVITGTSWAEDLRPLLNRGTVYVKDPSTRLAPELLAPRPGESVLDLCAAPGGKAYDLAHLMERRGTLVAVDLPGQRIERLRQNLDNLATSTLRCAIVEADVLTLQPEILAKQALPPQYDAVMLDAPCSNTGVIQRRTDVKWRLRPKDVKACTRLQIALLKAAAQFVKPGGRLVYSTCSIETAENRAVVDTFLSSPEGRHFSLQDRATSYPWQTGHDGAGAFLLTASAV